MPRIATADFDATAATQKIVLFRTNRPIRIKEIGFYATVAVSGGAGITCQVGYSGGAEIVASASVAAPTTVDTSAAFTILNAIVPASTNVVFRVTATTRSAGRYSVYVIWDNDN